MVWRMRPAALLGGVLVLACTLGARADDDGPEEAPLLARIVSAAQTGDTAQLAALGQEALDSPDVDPWIVADVLGAGGNVDAARAFAKALPVESEALLAYLGTQAAQQAHEDVRAALDAVLEDAADGLWHKASLQLDGIEMPADLRHVLATRTVWVRVLVLEQTGRAGDAAQLAFGAARLAESLGYVRGFGAISLYQRCLECAVPQGAHDLALDALQRLYTLQAEHEGLSSLYGTAVDQASVELLRGQAPNALSRLLEADRLAEQLAAPVLRAIAHSMMQEAYEMQGLYPQALRARAAADAYFESLSHADDATLARLRDVGFDPTRERWDHVVRCACLDMALGQSGAAEDRLRAAVEAATAAHDAIGLGVALGNRSRLHVTLGRWDEAAADLAAAERAFESMQGKDPDVPRQLAGVLNMEAELALQRTRFELREARRTGMVPAELQQLERHLASTQLRPGLARARAGLAAMARHGAWGGLASLRETIGSVFGALGQTEQALAVLEEARRDAGKHRLRMDEALVLTSLARVLLQADRHAEALRTARDAVDRIRDLAGGLPDHFRARAQLGVMDVYDIGALAASRLAAGRASASPAAGGGAGGREPSRGALRAARGGAGRIARAGPGRPGGDALRRATRRRSSSVRSRRSVTRSRPRSPASHTSRGPASATRPWRDTKQQLEQAYGRAALAQAEALGEVQRHLAEDPRLAGLRPLPADPQRLAAVPGEAFVILGLLGDEAWAVVCAEGQVREVQLAATPAEVARIEADVQQLTTFVAGRANPTSSRPLRQAALARLRATLVDRLGLREGLERLVLCPDGGLAYLPWSLLFEGAPSKSPPRPRSRSCPPRPRWPGSARARGAPPGACWASARATTATFPKASRSSRSSTSSPSAAASSSAPCPSAGRASGCWRTRARRS